MEEDEQGVSFHLPVKIYSVRATVTPCTGIGIKLLMNELFLSHCTFIGCHKHMFVFIVQKKLRLTMTVATKKTWLWYAAIIDACHT